MKGNLAPILNASFDIECYSYHGDMPLAIKGCSREAKIIIESNPPFNDPQTLSNLLTSASKGDIKNAGPFGKIYFKIDDIAITKK